MSFAVSVIRMEPDMSASGGNVAGDYPSSWSKVWKLKVVDLKALCSKLNLSVRGRKDDLADRVCLALGISKSGASGETDVKPYACSAFDTNTHQQYLGLGKLSAVSGEWSADLASMPTSFV